MHFFEINEANKNKFTSSSLDVSFRWKKMRESKEKSTEHGEIWRVQKMKAMRGNTRKKRRNKNRRKLNLFLALRQKNTLK